MSKASRKVTRCDLPRLINIADTSPFLISRILLVAVIAMLRIYLQFQAKHSAWLHLQGDNVEDGADSALAARLAVCCQQLQLLLVPELHPDVDGILVKGIAAVELRAAAVQGDLPVAPHAAQHALEVAVDCLDHALNLWEPARLQENCMSQKVVIMMISSHNHIDAPRQQHRLYWSQLAPLVGSEKVLAEVEVLFLNSTAFSSRCQSSD